MLTFENFEVLTFDCYGTLIDWETGITEALNPVLTAYNVHMSVDQILELYGELESKIERGEYQEYKTVLKMVLDGIGARRGFVPTQSELDQFSVSVRDWPPFPDSVRALQALNTKYKLAIVSNIDDDLFAFSAKRLQVKFEWVITAQQARSYKPSLNNFYYAFNKIGVSKDKILHIAQSIFHDIVPAKQLGLSTVWINRRVGKAGFGATPSAHAQADMEFPDLQSLATGMGLM